MDKRKRYHRLRYIEAMSSRKNEMRERRKEKCKTNVPSRINTHDDSQKVCPVIWTMGLVPHSSFMNE